MEGMAYALLNESVGVRALPVRDNTHRVAGSLQNRSRNLSAKVPKMAGGTAGFWIAVAA
jgi:hypothetical protein